MAGNRLARRRTSDQRRSVGDYDRRVVGGAPSCDHRRNVRGIMLRPPANPLAPSVYGEAQIRIYRLILGVIAVFVLMYLGLVYAYLASG
jgi:hypothetical protein